MSEGQANRINRRQVVEGAIGGAAALALASKSVGAAPSSGAATSGLTRAQTTSNVPTPRNETLIVEQGTNNVWDSFNPFIPNGEAYNYGLAQVCRENFFLGNFLTGEVIPWLATKHEYNADFTESTLYLNPAAAWSDGTPFTADDVVFYIELMAKNPNFSNATYMNETVKSAVAKDANTVVFTLTGAFPRFHYNYYAGIIADNFRIVPKHIWETQEAGTFTFNPPVYTGPYTLQESSSTKLYYLWQKSATYWNKAALDPVPGYVAYIQQTSMDAAVQEFLAGNVDVTSADYPNQQVISSQYENQTGYQFPDPCPRGLWFNAESPTGLFATKEGRWALSYLIDRDTIARTIWQPETVAATYPWANYPGWTKWAPDSVMSEFDLTFNPQKAEEALDALGATKNGDKRQFNGKDLSLSLITPVLTSQPEYQIAVSFAQACEKVGITVDVKSLPGSAFGDAFSLGQFDMTSHWICGMQFDPDQLFMNFHSKYYTPIGTNANQGGDPGKIRFKSADLDKIIDQMDIVNPEDEANQQLFFDGLKTFETELPCVPSIQTIYPFMYNTTYWTSWPDQANPTTIPANWWGQFLQTIGNLKASGS